MNELQRMIYLDALGIDSYVSRRQLPGAAVTRRLAIVPSLPVAAARKPEVQGAPPIAPLEEVSTRAGSGRRAQSDSAVRSSPAQQAVSHHGSSVPRFSLTAIVAGDWLWLEELADMPLTMEQVRLVQSMARAMSLAQGHGEKTVTSGVRPEVAQFDWPIHTNHQLDLGEEAARAGVAGFVGRKLEQYGCGGLVLLGQSCATRVPVQEMTIQAVSTASSAEILARPALKAEVWRDLLPLVGRA
jgi:hypothetical protein